MELLTLGPRLREPLAAGLATLLPRLLERLLVGVQAQRAVAKECITRRAHAGSNLKVAYAQAGLLPHTYYQAKLLRKVFCCTCGPL